MYKPVQRLHAPRLASPTRLNTPLGFCQKIIHLLQAKVLVGALCVLSFAAIPACTHTNQPAYQNPLLPVQTRVSDLIKRMTLEEKIQQMQNKAPAIKRLGVQEYNWWSEGLHGVARASTATVFPQAIGLAATWNENLMFKVATAISDEARAKHHHAANQGKRHYYQGLTLWSPNINIFRDPRWGRGQETYGEDPYLSGRLAVQFIRGLQGDNKQHLKTVATVKHFAVHNGPEPERHSFDAVIDDRDLHQNYLPQFEMAIKTGAAQSLMCAYNRVNGVPACASPKLLNHILRQDWGFTGFVVSDCGAILDIHKYHKVTQTPEQSAALSVKAGTDLNCGDTYGHLPKAVQQGLISEAEIDLALSRLFTARMQLGMFDAPQSRSHNSNPHGNPYAQIPYSVVDSRKHQTLALEAARESIVLLKNKNNTLPLSKNIKSIAVIGPNADQWLMLQGNYFGLPSNPITPLEGIKSVVSEGTQVSFAQGSGIAENVPVFYPIPSPVLSHGGKPGIRAEFFNRASLDGTALYSQTHQTVDANWVERAPRADMDSDNFAVRWRGQLTPSQSGRYKIGLLGTCKTTVSLDGKQIIQHQEFADELSDPRTKSSDWLTLEAGKSYNVEVTAIDTFADARVQLQWAAPQPKLKAQAIDLAENSDAVVMFMGLTPMLEGEEMDVEVDGFRGGDRTKLGLPKVQQQLIKDITALGKPTVLVALNGSALAINWAQDNVPAIVEAWYPGQAAGQAIADVLFGNYNPAGRLPVTFYKSESQLPPFEDYRITNQTYRYFKGEPLYPFGFGLSYSTFNYSDFSAPSQIPVNTSVDVEVSVQNTSNRDGDEVVQVYAAQAQPDARAPIQSLVAFERIQLAAGSKKTLKLRIPKEAFSSFNSHGERTYKPGDFTLKVGNALPAPSRQQSRNSLQLRLRTTNN